MSDTQTETVTPSAVTATPEVTELNVPTTDNLADFFHAELQAERDAKPAPKAKATEPEAPIEAAEEETPLETEVETAEEAEPDGDAHDDELSADTAKGAPSGLSESERAEYAKLPPAMQSIVSKLAAAQQADYTRKTQAVAEQRREVEQAVNTVKSQLQQYDAILSKFTTPQIQPPDANLRATDPDLYNDQMAQFVHAKHIQEQAAREQHRVRQEQAEIEQKQLSSYWTEQAQVLSTLAPELAHPEKGDRLRKEVLEYAKTVGYTPDQLKVASARDVVTLWKAQRFDAIEKAKKSATVVTPQAPKTVKPGPAKGIGRPSNFATAVKNLSTNPSRDALAAAFAAEIASER